MASRIVSSQSEHDKVIHAAYDELDKVNHDVYINPGQSNKTSVAGYYPDIIITNKGENSVKFIIEVETSDSINQNEVSQWQNFSTKISGTFYLLVPFDCKNIAEILCRQNGIKARFGTYKKDSSGSINSIQYE
jgi:hypothetical protein